MNPIVNLCIRSRALQTFRAFSSTFNDQKCVQEKFLDSDIEDIKIQLRQFEGGEVTLNKNETNGIAKICIDHVEKKNSLSGKMMVEFHDVISSLETWENGKGLLLCSKGDTFCSGGYLETVKALGTPENGFRMSTLMQDAVIRLRNLPLVSVAVVNGQALGGGAELTVCTDFRVCSVKTEIGFVQARMGITTGWGGGMFLKALVGHQKALDIMITSRKLKLDELKAVGLVDGVVNPASSEEESYQWLLSKVQHLPPNVAQAVKKNLSSSSFYEERQVFGSVWAGQVHLSKLALNIKHKE